ncbi:MAG: hypothetical protein HKL95_03955 [Phycisphaerae bacterium]|nr:hypothetical protein [Phycisphaerae bacterium]
MGPIAAQPRGTRPVDLRNLGVEYPVGAALELVNFLHLAGTVLYFALGQAYNFRMVRRRQRACAPRMGRWPVVEILWR